MKKPCHPALAILDSLWAPRIRLEWLSAAMFGLLSISLLAGERPNVVFFLVDDLGQRDLGCYGSQFYETPNLDRMAREGAKFNHAYAACPVCSPTRASLMTGQWPQRVGITDYIGAPTTPSQWKRNTRSLPAPYADRLPLQSPTLAKAMKNAGYATFFAGKWHLGPEGFWPENQGFDINRGGIDKGGPYGGNKYFSPYGNPRLSDGPEGEHLPDRLAHETNLFMEANRDRPFFAYFSFYSVHTPLMAREDLRKKYEEKRSKLTAKDEWGREHERDVRLVQSHAVYAAMVEAMDMAVGKVLAKIDELGLREKTIVIFTSDNGGLSTSEGWPTSNLPLRGGKGWMYEGGIREPLLIRWPGVIKPGSLVEDPVASPDFFPTLLEVAGSKPQDGQVLDGVSLVPIFEGRRLPERALYWHYPHYGNQGGAPGAAIRRGQWKLIEWQEDNHVELYDVVADTSESVDRSQDQPDLTRRLRNELHDWQKQVGAKFPIPNPDYGPSKPSGRGATRPQK
jgi:arylsulfatase A-like enzyme